MPFNLNLEALIRRVEGAQLKIRELQQSLEQDIGPGLQLKTWDDQRWVIYGYRVNTADQQERWYAAYSNAAIEAGTRYTATFDTLVGAYVQALYNIMGET